MINERRLILILSAINFTHIMDFMIMMPLGTYLIPLFKIDPREFAFIVSAYTFSAGISGFLAAFFVDKFDRKRVLLFGYMGFILGTFACAFAPTYPLLLTARIIAGTFGGLISAQVLSIVADSVPFERRASAMGMLMSAFAVASVIGVPLGLFLASKLSWHAPFIMIGSLGLLIIPMVMMTMPKMVGHISAVRDRPPLFSVITNITSDANQMRGLLLTAAMMIAHFSIIPFMATYMEFNVHFGKDGITYMYLIGGVASFFCSPLIGKLADRFGKFRVFATLSLLSLLPVYLITTMQVVPAYQVLIVTTMIFIFGGGRMVPAIAIVSSVVLPERRGSFMSINSSLQALAMGVASVIAGAIVYATPTGELVNYQYVGYIGMGVSLLCILIAKTVRPVDLSGVKGYATPGATSAQSNVAELTAD